MISPSSYHNNIFYLQWMLWVVRISSGSVTTIISVIKIYICLHLDIDKMYQPTWLQVTGVYRPTVPVGSVDTFDKIFGEPSHKSIEQTLLPQLCKGFSIIMMIVDHLNCLGISITFWFRLRMHLMKCVSTNLPLPYTVLCACWSHAPLSSIHPSWSHPAIHLADGQGG